MHEALEADLVQKVANKGKTFHIVLIAPIRTAPSHCKTQLIFSLGCFSKSVHDFHKSRREVGVSALCCFQPDTRNMNGPDMIHLDLALRGGPITLLLLLAALLWRVYWVGRAFIGYGAGSIQVQVLNYYGGTAARSAPEFGDKPHTLIQFHASSSDIADRDYIP